MPDKNRQGPSVAVAAGDDIFIVDICPGSARNLITGKYQKPIITCKMTIQMY